MKGMTENLLYRESEENALFHSEKSLWFGIQIQNNPMLRSQSALFKLAISRIAKEITYQMQKQIFPLELHKCELETFQIVSSDLTQAKG